MDNNKDLRMIPELFVSEPSALEKEMYEQIVRLNKQAAMIKQILEVSK